jgi:hypothetical protein
MSKLKKIVLSEKSEATVSDALKGSAANPYSKEEKALFSEESWPGGYVEGLGYLPPASYDGFDYSSESSGSGQGGITLAGKYDKLSDYTQNLLRTLSGYSGTIYITSIARTPAEQASVMLTNIKRTGVDAQLKLYKEPGKQVIRVYDPQKSDAVNLQNMTAKIYEVGPQNVSHHCADQNLVNVFDVSKTRLSNVDNFVNAVSAVAQHVIVEDNCVHVEIEQ